MRTITNTTGTKAVNLLIDGTGVIRAMYVQIYDGQEQVLETETYSTMKRAIKWAISKIN
ncbi:MAG: hypothetical protein O2887_10425 [Bacteroidetes bacterium]|nr:hypothetical protein [Bacteroidota bacterium]